MSGEFSLEDVQRICGPLQDIGHDVWARYIPETSQVAYAHPHQSRPGHYCSAEIAVDETRHGKCWKLVSADPLTIEPSLLCGCGHHGFIRGGRWVPA